MKSGMLILCIDRLGTRFLGPYGGTWMPTPAFDRLACESLTCDFAFAEGDTLQAAYRGFWLNLHGSSRADSMTQSIARDAHEADRQTILITDEQELLNLAGAADFHEQILLADRSSNGSPSESIEETWFGHFTHELVELTQSATSSTFLWAHFGGLGRRWDSPLENRETLRDEDDPAPWLETTPPSLRLTNSDDPDAALPYVLAYAAELTTIDHFLALLLDSLPPNWDFVLLSPRGFPLGEHGFVGSESAAPYEELLHTPFLVRRSDGAGKLARRQGFTVPADLHATIASLWNSNKIGWGIDLFCGGDFERGRDRVLHCCQKGSGIRTNAWHWVAPEVDARPGQLFAKPDDRFEINDVAQRVREVPETMQSVLEDMQFAVSERIPFAHPPLPEILVSGHR